MGIVLFVLLFVLKGTIAGWVVWLWLWWWKEEEVGEKEVEKKRWWWMPCLAGSFCGGNLCVRDECVCGLELQCQISGSKRNVFDR